MSAPATALGTGHIHLTSIHHRSEDGLGYDFEIDFYIRGRGRGQRAERVTRLVMIEGGQPALTRVTRDILCPEDLEELRANLPVLLDKRNPAAREAMELYARAELGRERRIAAGLEAACVGCGCSESRACSGGCIWVSETRCSRCVCNQC